MIEPIIPVGSLIGLSVRYCIDDLIHRRLKLDRVDRFIVDTAHRNAFEWENRVRLGGMHGWWQRDPMFALRILDQLLSEGRIHQPLLDGLDPIEFEPGQHWVAAGPDPEF